MRKQYYVNCSISPHCPPSHRLSFRGSDVSHFNYSHRPNTAWTVKYRRYLGGFRRIVLENRIASGLGNERAGLILSGRPVVPHKTYFRTGPRSWCFPLLVFRPQMKTSKTVKRYVALALWYSTPALFPFWLMVYLICRHWFYVLWC